MYDLARIKVEVEDTLTKAGCKLTVPVVINGRLTRTLGRVMYASTSNYVYPRQMEFSKQFLETASDDSIHQTILHECAHYIAVCRTNQRHGHDEYFKSICKEIGCTNDKSVSPVERLVSAEKTYKYTIYCSNCGFIGGYHRWCHTLDMLPYCACKKCGGQELSYVVNN